MDATSENGVAAKMTVEVAARILGIKEESVRKRVRRGKMRFEKGADGRLYVYLDSTEAVRDEDGPGTNQPTPLGRSWRPKTRRFASFNISLRKSGRPGGERTRSSRGSRSSTLP